MKMNRVYRKEMEMCRSIANICDRVPNWVIVAVYSTVISWGVFWYA